MQTPVPVPPLNSKVRLRCRLSDVALMALDDLAAQNHTSRTGAVNKLTPEWVSTLRFVVPADEAPAIREAREKYPTLTWHSLMRLMEDLDPAFIRHPTALYPTINNVVLLAEWAEQLPDLSYGGATLPTARAALSLEVILRGWVTEID